MLVYQKVKLSHSKDSLVFQKRWFQDVPSHWRAMAKGETFGDWIILGTTSPPRLWNLSTNWMALYKERMVYVCLCSYPGVTLQLIQNIFWFFIPLKSMT